MILWLYLGMGEHGKTELYVRRDLDFRVHLYRNRLYLISKRIHLTLSVVS